MSRHLQLYQWIDTVTMRFPSLSKPQDLGLALWSFRYGHCLLEQLNCCSRGVAPLFGQSHNTLRKRLSPRGGCCLSVAKQKLKPMRRWISKNLWFLVRYGGAETLADSGYFPAWLVFDNGGLAEQSASPCQTPDDRKHGPGCPVAMRNPWLLV